MIAPTAAIASNLSHVFRRAPLNMSLLRSPTVRQNRASECSRPAGAAPDVCAPHVRHLSSDRRRSREHDRRLHGAPGAECGHRAGRRQALDCEGPEHRQLVHGNPRRRGSRSGPGPRTRATVSWSRETPCSTSSGSSRPARRARSDSRRSMRSARRSRASPATFSGSSRSTQHASDRQRRANGAQADERPTRRSSNGAGRLAGSIPQALVRSP